MSTTKKIIPFALVMLPLLSSCGRAPEVVTIEQMPPPPAATAVGTASGKGIVELTTWDNDATGSSTPKTVQIEFVPKFSYAYSETAQGKRRLWVVVADQTPDTGALNDTDDRAEALRLWCERQHATYVAFKMDGNAKPEGSLSCAGDGRSNAMGVNVANDLPSMKIDLSLNDGKRVQGSIGAGEGSQEIDGKPAWVHTTATYSFAADLASPTLRDRVLADGDERARGLAGANAAFLQYWKAAGNAKSLTEVETWFTPERQANATLQTATLLAAGVKESFMRETFVKSHAQTPEITGGKAIGAAAVILSGMSADGEKMKCQTLMLQLGGAWKVGNENCS